MQSIVADTTPLNYLVLIQAADILPELYRTVLIPPAVKAELAHANTPAVVRAWISHMYIVRQLTGASLQEIGRQFGGMHHSSVLHAIRKIEGMRRMDPNLNQGVTALMETVSH